MVITVENRKKFSPPMYFVPLLIGSVSSVYTGTTT